MLETLHGKIEQVEIAEEMSSSYMDYAMSVIVGRALPDVRDGLKPVHRRVLYGMHDSGMQPNRPYRKCARIVGDVMGKYHPHGDVAIYDTLVRMAQDFSFRSPLVDGHGNFGSVDGDSAAAMRYTECRLTRIATEMLREIDADTVDWVPNYDESTEEPVVLPARFPNLLVNGASGIAVGMTTNIPPHNLGETIDAVQALIDNPDVGTEELMKHMPGPDFPTGGLIMGMKGIKDAYETGRGRVLVRAKVHSEPLKQGKTALVVSEIPYQVNKDRLERIAHLEEILEDEARVFQIIKEELAEIKAMYADERRTELAPSEDELDIEDLIAVEEMAISLTKSGYVKRLPVTTYRTQRRGGIGVMGMDLKDGDYIEHLFITTTHHYLLFVTSRGLIYRLKVHELPLGSRQSKGKALINLLPMQSGETVRAVIATKDYTDAEYLAFGTRNGLVKKTSFKEYDTHIKTFGIIAVKLTDGDELVGVRHTRGDDDLIMVSSEGKAIRFHESDVRPTGRDTQGVRGMDLPEGHRIVGMATAQDDADLFCVTGGGFGKRTAISSYRTQKRGGLGVITIKDSPDRGDLVAVATVRDNHELMMVSHEGTVIRIPVESIRSTGRSTMGVRVMNLRSGDRVASMARVVVDSDGDVTPGQEKPIEEE